MSNFLLTLREGCRLVLNHGNSILIVKWLSDTNDRGIAGGYVIGCSKKKSGILVISQGQLTFKHGGTDSLQPLWTMAVQTETQHTVH